MQRLANYDSNEDATVDVSESCIAGRPTATAIRLSVVMRSEPHSVPPIIVCVPSSARSRVGPRARPLRRK